VNAIDLLLVTIANEARIFSYHEDRFRELADLDIPRVITVRATTGHYLSQKQRFSNANQVRTSYSKSNE
jgi:hypothetical protein